MSSPDKCLPGFTRQYWIAKPGIHPGGLNMLGEKVNQSPTKLLRTNKVEIKVSKS
jgi:hypothetical protein